MITDTSTYGSVLVAKVTIRRLDAESIQTFKVQLLSQITSSISTVVLNLSGVSFIDSSGLGGLVAIKKQLGQSGNVIFTEAQTTIKSMFKLTRMDKIFKFYDKHEKALKVLNLPN